MGRFGDFVNTLHFYLMDRFGDFVITLDQYLVGRFGDVVTVYTIISWVNLVIMLTLYGCI